MEEKEKPVFNTSEDIIKYIKDRTKDSKDMVYRDLDIQGTKMNVVYNESMTSTTLISDFVIRSIKETLTNKINQEKLDKIENKLNKYIDDNLEVDKTKKTKKEKQIDNLKDQNQKNNDTYLVDEILNALETNISISKVEKLDLSKDDIFYYLFSAFTCIIYNQNVIAVETRGTLERSIPVSNAETTLTGPKDAFLESYQQNIGLIRKRLKSEKLILEEEVVGRRGKAKVGILYVDDIAKDSIVKDVKKKLKKIDIDAILGTNYLIEILEDSNKGSLPTMISTERPDRVCSYLLQGRVALVVENSPYVIVVPAFLLDFINNMEDNYQKSRNVVLTKFIRYIAFVITLVTPAVYVALITYNQEAIPPDLLVSFVSQRASVPFPAFIESLLMMLAFEILRECDYRVINSGGSTISIVGALILGEAAVSAGIVSPITIIVIAITTISGLMFSDVNVTNALFTWRIIFLIFSYMGGLIGVSAAALLFMTKLASRTSFSKPFTYPIAPVNFSTIKKEFIKRANVSEDKNRKKILTDNLTKYRQR